MVRTWVSGGQSSEAVDKIRIELSELEKKRDELIDTNKSKIFQWAARVVKSGSATDKLASEVKEIIAEYDSLCQTIFDKEVLLSERLDEQAKFDSLG
jgi:outer membrane murein-binding lipoprotein Lpp